MADDILGSTAKIELDAERLGEGQAPPSSAPPPPVPTSHEEELQASAKPSSFDADEANARAARRNAVLTELNAARTAPSTGTDYASKLTFTAPADTPRLMPDDAQDLRTQLSARAAQEFPGKQAPQAEPEVVADSSAQPEDDFGPRTVLGQRLPAVGIGSYVVTPEEVGARRAQVAAEIAPENTGRFDTFGEVKGRFAGYQERVAGYLSDLATPSGSASPDGDDTKPRIRPQFESYKDFSERKSDYRTDLENLYAQRGDGAKVGSKQFNTELQENLVGDGMAEEPEHLTFGARAGQNLGKMMKGQGAYALAYGAGSLLEDEGRIYAEQNDGRYYTPEEKSTQQASSLQAIGTVAGAIAGGVFGEPIIGAGIGGGLAGIAQASIGAGNERDQGTRQEAEKLAAAMGEASSKVQDFRGQLEATGAPIQTLSAALTAAGSTGTFGSGTVAGVAALTTAFGDHADASWGAISKSLAADPMTPGLARRFSSGQAGSADIDSLAYEAAEDGDFGSLKTLQQAAGDARVKDDSQFQGASKHLDDVSKEGLGSGALSVGFAKWYRQYDSTFHNDITDALDTEDRRRETLGPDPNVAEQNRIVNEFADAKSRTLGATANIGRVEAEGGSAADLSAARSEARSVLQGNIARYEQDEANPVNAARKDDLDAKIDVAQTEIAKSYRADFDTHLGEETSGYDLNVLRSQLEGKSAAEIQQQADRQADYLEGVARGPIAGTIARPSTPSAADASSPLGHSPAAGKLTEGVDPELQRLQGLKTTADQAQSIYLRSHIHGDTDEGTLKTLHTEQVAAAGALDAYENSPAKRAEREIAAAQQRGRLTGDSPTAGSGDASSPVRLSPTDRAKMQEEALQLRYSAQQAVFAENLTHDDNVIGQAAFGVSKARSFGSADDVYQAQTGELDSFKSKIAELTQELQRGGQTVADYARESRELTQTQQAASEVTAQRRDERIASTESINSSQLAIDSAGLGRKIALGGSAAIPIEALDADTKATLAGDRAAIDSLPVGSPARKTAEAKLAGDAAAGQERDDNANIYVADVDTRMGDVRGEGSLRRAESAFQRSLEVPYLDGGINTNPLQRGNELLSALGANDSRLTSDFDKETAQRDKLQKEGKWNPLAEEGYVRDQERYEDSLDTDKNRRAQLQHDKLENFLGAVPESILGERGLSAGLGVAITPTSALSAYFDPSPVTGHFGPNSSGAEFGGVGGAPYHAYQTAHGPAQPPSAAPHSSPSQAPAPGQKPGIVPHGGAGQMHDATNADIVKAVRDLIMAVQQAGSKGGGFGLLAPQAAVHAHEQYQSTTGRY